MKFVVAVVSSAMFCCVFGDFTFPPDFKFGVASSAYQIEGAWNVGGKGESIWDRFVHTNPDAIKKHGTGDVACDSYQHWKRDVQLIADLGVQFYRFSISWSRILPTGLPNVFNEEGVAYYNNLIDELIRNKIDPVVTIYHWDLPQRLQDLGGWTNPFSSEWFADYATVVYSLYSDRVKTWITINEPVIMCDIAYNTGSIAPGVVDPDLGTLLCSKNVLMAHAKAYRIYDEKFKPKHKGQVSLANHIFWYEAASEDDMELTELVYEYGVGRFSHPIYSKEGGWPKKLKQYIANKSKEDGYTRSRLPDFTQEEADFIKGTYDFFGLNHYSSRVVRKARDGEKIGAWPLMGAPELGAVLEGRHDWQKTGCEWLMVHPEGLRQQLSWIKKQYGDMNIFITENGLATLEDDLDDYNRIQYFKGYLEQVLLSIKEDGVNVTAYTAWSLIDDFEWFDGYTQKFGLHKVDFNDPERKRTPRLSAKFYRTVTKKRSLDVQTEYTKDEL